ncbi:MAG: hypothetical protein HY510_01775 [Acidobacteria bacterium]|nr:hypothetical protein [Acidobacteriota bacterium]
MIEYPARERRDGAQAAACPGPHARGARPLLVGLFLTGIALSLLLVARSQVGADQLILLARGWLLITDGHWVPFGNPTSRGGAVPGGATAVVVGLPLLVWRDDRAATLLITILHALGYWMLDRLLRATAGVPERVLFAVLYWLNPWRLYYSGFLWNPNYLFFFGAVHAWTVHRQRRQPSGRHSFLLVVTLGLAFQLHPSALLLLVATALLWLRGYFRMQWAACACGAVAVAASLVPWALHSGGDPASLPGSGGFAGRGLLFVFPLLRGVLYWLRYGSLWISGKLVSFDFTRALGPEASALVAPLARGIALAVAVLTPGFTILANLRLWRSPVLRRLRSIDPDASGRGWIRGYVRWCFVAAVLVFAIAPTTIMNWQVLALFHAAVLPIVLWAGAMARTRQRRWVWRSAAAWTAASVLIGVAMAFGSPRYYWVERSFEVPTLRYDHPMLHELGIQDRCPLRTNDPEGWWPDILPPGPPNNGDPR